MIIILAIFFVLFPATINMPDQTQQYSVVLGVGIDKSGDEFEVSTQILTSKSNQGFLESLQVHSAKSKNMLDAVEELSLHLGRISGFGNTSVIVFSEEVAKEGIAETLDFFVRSKRLNGNPFIVITKKDAKELLSDIAKIDESFNYSLNSLAKLNQEFSIGTIVTLNDFLNNFYSKTTASVISQINQTNNEDDGILIPESNGSNSSGGTNNSGNDSSSNNSSQEKKVISNKGEGSLFVGSKQIAVANQHIIEGMNILSGAKRNSFTINNVSDEIYRNATVIMSLKGSLKTRKLGFSKQGIPRVFYCVNYIVKVEQILQNGVDPILLNGSNNYLTKTLIQKTKDQILNDAGNSVAFFKQYNADVYGLQQAYYRHHPKKWAKYLESLNDKTTAFKNIEFFLDIKINGSL